MNTKQFTLKQFEKRGPLGFFLSQVSLVSTILLFASSHHRWHIAA